MIPKANQRSGGQQLATHLMNEFDNDRVELAEVRGAVAQDLHGAFAEWRAEADATKCRKYLYSLSINPDQRQRPITREEYYDFIARTEKKLGLENQPRAVIFHVKYGREHAHVVWSRIDLDKMKAVQLSHDRQKLRAVAQEFARDYGLQLPPGMRKNRGLERFNEAARPENLAEKQQQERTGIKKQDRIQDITEAWRQSDTALTFIRALEERGYYLARGARRAYVIVDRAGEIHSLSRQIEGATARDIKARLSQYPLDQLPEATKAQKFARQKRQAQAERENTEREKAGQEKAVQPHTPTPQQRREALATAHAKRRAVLDKQRAELLERQKTEREALLQAQRAGTQAVAAERLKQRPTGIMAFLARITGLQALTAFRHAREDKARNQTHQLQREALERRQNRERHEIVRRSRALKRVETRERRSLETLLRRERLQGQELIRAARLQQRTEQQQLTPTQERKVEEFKRNPADITAPTKHSRGIFGRLKDIFSRHAAPENEQRISDEDTRARDKQPEQTDPAKLSTTFKRHAAKESQQTISDEDTRARDQNEKTDPTKLSTAFNRHAAKEHEDRKQDDSLTARFKARAAQKKHQQDQEKKGPRGPGPGRRN